MTATYEPGDDAPLVHPKVEAGRDIHDYDEFGLLQENAEEAGIEWRGPPPIERVRVDLPDGRIVSALKWGSGDPHVVFVHGGAQNAHTWDTVALALNRPVLAVDLPGHGHSSWKDDGDYSPRSLADDVAVAIRQVAPKAQMLVGMSLGGLTSIALAAKYPELVRRLAVVDVTPGTTRDKASAIVAFVSGPERFDSFDEILQRTIAFNPTRSESSLRRGILHNARPIGDGGWVWRYDRRRPEAAEADRPDFGPMWDDVSAVAAPILLLRGALSPVVDDEDVAEFRRRQADVEVVMVDGAGHSIQGDRPVELARLLEEFLQQGRGS